MVSARSVQGVEHGFPHIPGPRPSGQTRARSGILRSEERWIQKPSSCRSKRAVSPDTGVETPGSIPLTISLAGYLQGPHPRPEGSFRRALKDMDGRSFVCSGRIPTGVRAHPGHIHHFPLPRILRSSWEEMSLWMLGQSHPIRTTWTDEIGRASCRERV